MFVLFFIEKNLLQIKRDDRLQTVASVNVKVKVKVEVKRYPFLHAPCAMHLAY
jgi:hypothetical protein